MKGKKVKKKLFLRLGRERTQLSFFIVLLCMCVIGVLVLKGTFSDKAYYSELLEENKDSIVAHEPSTHEIHLNNPVFLLQKINNHNKTLAQEKANLSPRKVSGVPIQSDWQPVSNAADKFYVYSAYYNNKPAHTIRVIGAAKTKTRQKIQCRLYDHDGNHYSTIDGTIRTIRENWNLKYSACFVVCHLSPEISEPRYISVVSESSAFSSATNILRVQYAQEEELQHDSEASLVDFSACVKPIHFNYDNTLEFIEWIEFHKLMGIQHFTFYNHSIGETVGCLLRHVYQNQVTVLPWNLPMISQKEIRTEGLFAALNDCVYRHRGLSKYLLLVDLDEMIVPRRAKNYSQLLDDLHTISSKKKVGAYSFQNGFFYLQWPNDSTNYNLTTNPLAATVSQHLRMLRKTRRRSRLHPHKQRSKYICDPQKVVEAGNHFVWEMTLGYHTFSVPPHLASLHHYRVCEFGGNQCVNTPSIVDKSIGPFGGMLAVNVAKQLEEVTEKCQVNIGQLLGSPKEVTS